MERLLDLAPSREPTLASTAGGWWRLRCPLPRSDLSVLLLALDMVRVLPLTSDGNAASFVRAYE